MFLYGFFFFLVFNIEIKMYLLLFLLLKVSRNSYISRNDVPEVFTLGEIQNLTDSADQWLFKVIE